MPMHTHITSKGVNLGISKHARAQRDYLSQANQGTIHLFEREPRVRTGTMAKRSHWNKWVTTKSKVSIHSISNNKKFKLFSSFCNLNPNMQVNEILIR